VYRGCASIRRWIARVARQPYLDLERRGAAIRDGSGRLETSGEVMANAKLRRPDDVDAPLFADWLRQARELTLGAISQSG
jgi:hypothetical protein